MTIEYVPRSGPAPGGSWRTAPGSTEAPAPSHDEVDGLGAVRVPVVPRRVTVPIARWWILAVVLSNGLHRSRWEGASFSVSSWLIVATALVAAFVLYRWLRLRPATATDQRDVVLSSAGIHTSGLVVLCEAREVHNPTALANALEELVANPVARELLSGMEGQRLVATGPSWRAAA